MREKRATAAEPRGEKPAAPAAPAEEEALARADEKLANLLGKPKG